MVSTRSGDLPVGRFVDGAVHTPLQKYFASVIGRNISISRGHPTPPEGRIAIVTDAGWNAVDAAASSARRDRRAGRKICERSTARGREMLQRTAKSCGPDAPTLASRLPMLCRPYRASDTTLVRKRRWQKSPVTGEITKETVKTIACGNAGRFRCTRCYSCAFYYTKCTRGCGCSGHPAFPTPSLGERFSNTSGASRRENGVVCGTTSTSLRSQ